MQELRDRAVGRRRIAQHPEGSLEYGNHSILTQPAGRGWRGRPKGAGPNRWTALLFAAVACAVLAGCAPRRPEPPAPGPATTSPRAAVPAGAREFEVDPEASAVTMLVRRAGKLSGFGHVHVVTSDGETGRVWFGAAPDLLGFEVRVPVDAFVVDDPAARAAARPEFAANVPEEARTGTRRNMLGPSAWMQRVIRKSSSARRACWMMLPRRN